MKPKQIKFDPMNGHLEHPWAYFVVFCVMMLLCAGLFLFSLYAMAEHPKPNDLITISTQFSSYEVKNKTKSWSQDLLLYAKDYEYPFILEFYEGYETLLESPSVLSSGKTYILEVSKGKERYFIYTIYNPDGTPCLTYEEHQQGYKNSQGTAGVLMAIFSAVLFCFFLFGIIYTRHPERYPAWVEKVYYKKYMLRR